MGLAVWNLCTGSRNCQSLGATQSPKLSTGNGNRQREWLSSSLTSFLISYIFGLPTRAAEDRWEDPLAALLLVAFKWSVPELFVLPSMHFCASAEVPAAGTCVVLSAVSVQKQQEVQKQQRTDRQQSWVLSLLGSCTSEEFQDLCRERTCGSLLQSYVHR